jgi:hypothetical protein
MMWLKLRAWLGREHEQYSSEYLLLLYLSVVAAVAAVTLLNEEITTAVSQVAREVAVIAGP